MNPYMRAKKNAPAPFPVLAGGAALRHWRETVLVMICLAMLAGFMLRGPMAQNPAYHDFADHRQFFDVPNLFDVASNLPFLIIGIAGIALVVSQGKPPLSESWLMFFIGSVATFFGSSYYHLAPSNETLVWDRLPMTVAFMAMFVALVHEHMGERLDRFLLVPAILLGLASAVWWHVTDDLRLYFWVQFTPMVCIPVLLTLFPGRYTHRGDLLYGLGLYGLAKFAEIWDRQIFALTGNTVSGHSLKHMFAAGALLVVFFMLRRRERVAPVLCKRSVGDSWPKPVAISTAPINGEHEAQS